MSHPTATEAPVVARARMDTRSLLVTVVPIVAIAWIVWSFRPATYRWQQYLGLIAAISGGSLLTAARLQLGGSFSVTPQARQLVTGGLYRYLRHPVYVFSALLLAGLALYTKPVFLLALLLIIPLQIRRARAEERVLESKFGAEYLAYRSRTWF